jgi:hypothetical protein
LIGLCLTSTNASILHLPVPLTLSPPSRASACTFLDLRDASIVSFSHRTENHEPFRDMRTRSRVPLPPSQKPVPRRATSEAWHTPQSSGRKFCSREPVSWLVFLPRARRRARGRRRTVAAVRGQPVSRLQRRDGGRDLPDHAVGVLVGVVAGRVVTSKAVSQSRPCVPLGMLTCRTETPCCSTKTCRSRQIRSRQLQQREGRYRNQRYDLE